MVLSIPDWGATPFAAGRDRAAIGRDIDAFNAVNRAESTRAGVRYVDVTAETRGATTRPDLLADDSLHPSAAHVRRVGHGRVGNSGSGGPLTFASL